MTLFSVFMWIFFLFFRVGTCNEGVWFTRHPANQTVSQGNEVRLGCAVQGVPEPDIVWIKDGHRQFSTDQMFVPMGDLHWETFHNVKSVQQQDAGQYWCEVEFHGLTFSSEKAWITVEGVPHITEEPQDVSMFPGQPFNLTCSAVGPPEPVEVLWWLGGRQEGGAHTSPSVLHVPGVNSSVKFYCEAKNARGISVSRTGTVYIKVLPSAPSAVQVVTMVNNSVSLSWRPGFNGYSQLKTCTVQLSRRSGRRTEHTVSVPPHSAILSSLRSHSNFSCRVSCSNELGASPYSLWSPFTTPEAAPSTYPRNLTFDLSDQSLSLSWNRLTDGELQGKLMAYKLQWSIQGEAQEPLLFKEPQASLSGGSRFFNSSFQVSACTSVGCGPWSPPVLVLPAAVELVGERSHLWVGVLLGLLVATVAGLMLTVMAKHRGKETQFGSAFKPAGPQCVSFTAARSFNRNTSDPNESTLDSLGINADLKNKLQDVLIPERLITLGHMLGKGEFGSVREAYLRAEDSSVRKVAVKVLKSDITSSGDIEQCLKEAAYMKDFHHPNVIQLIGVSLHRRPGQRLPIPMVVLPFMKHGDLHTFLLLSRLGEEPFTIRFQTLVQFMLDISRGMQYLSSRNIIHRDLAARNCMMDENMCVCVADFGLSKKIYSGDYYRQGSVSKLPVKWIALESLADNVYTTQSDVWAFGVTMWEVMTRGQTPYPGVENSEIYEFLIKGERLKKPPDCREDIYTMMHSCWSPVPKLRPSFQLLVSQLESLWLSLSPSNKSKQQQQALLYVNLETDDDHGNNNNSNSVCEVGVASSSSSAAFSSAAAMTSQQEVMSSTASSFWSVPWQRNKKRLGGGPQEEEEEEREEERDNCRDNNNCTDNNTDWMLIGSVIGGDYRYITTNTGSGSGSGCGSVVAMETQVEETREEEEEEEEEEEGDSIINV